MEILGRVCHICIRVLCRLFQTAGIVTESYVTDRIGHQNPDTDDPWYGDVHFGLHYVYIDNGSIKSLAAVTLLLIESMVMCGAVSSSDTGTGQLPRALFWVLIVGMAVAGVCFFVQEITAETQDSYGRVEVATMLWIAAGAWWYSMPVDLDSTTNIRRKKNKK